MRFAVRDLAADWHELMVSQRGFFFSVCLYGCLSVMYIFVVLLSVVSVSVCVSRILCTCYLRGE